MTDVKYLSKWVVAHQHVALWSGLCALLAILYELTHL